MALWFSPNHGTEFSDIGHCFSEQLFEDCFMAEFIAIKDSLESCKNKLNK